MRTAQQIRTEALGAQLTDKLGGPMGCMARHHAESPDRSSVLPANQRAIMIGNRMHRLVHNYFKPVEHGCALPDPTQFLARQAWGAGHFGAEQMDELESLARTALYHAARTIISNEMTVLAVERELKSKSIPLASLPPDVSPGLHARFTGRPDLIGLAGDRLVLVDWKTGQRLIDEEVLAKLPSTMILTCLAERDFLRSHPHVQAGSIEIVQVNLTTGDIVPVCLTGEQREESTALIRELIINLDRKRYPASTNLFCGSCPIRETCPEFVGPVDEDAL